MQPAESNALSLPFSYLVQITAANYINSISKSVKVQVFKGLLYFTSGLHLFLTVK